MERGRIDSIVVSMFYGHQIHVQCQHDRYQKVYRTFQGHQDHNL